MSKFKRKCLKSFKVVGISLPPLKRYIPVDDKRRLELWKAFEQQFSVSLPDYEQITRDKMDREDLRVLWDIWTYTYEYRGGLFRKTLYPGFIWDGASVPTILVFGSLTKNGQHIEEPAIAHDEDFANQEFPFFDCNVLFQAGILYQGELGNKRAKRIDDRAHFGVSSIIGKRLYDKGTPRETWQEGFYKHETLRKMEW